MLYRDKNVPRLLLNVPRPLLNVLRPTKRSEQEKTAAREHDGSFFIYSRSRFDVLLRLSFRYVSLRHFLRVVHFFLQFERVVLH